MFSMTWIFDRLIEAAAISLVLFTLGSVAVLSCRQPARRMRIIILTLAGSVLAPLVNLLPGLPHWSLPGIRSIAGPDRARSTAHRPGVAAPAQLADFRSTSEPLMTGATVLAGLSDPTGRPDSASDDQERSSDLLPAAVAMLPTATVDRPSTTAATEKPASTHMVVAAIPQRIDLATWIVGTYLVGAAALATWWILGFAGLRRMLRTARPAPGYCRALLREIAGQAGDRVQLLVSPRAPQPFTFGWHRPVIGNDERARIESRAAAQRHLPRVALVPGPRMVACRPW